MTAAVTTRLQIYTWSASTDEFNRAQLTTSHQSLEDRAAIFTSGLLSARPAAAVSNTRGFYLATDQSILYYSDGAAWTALNSYGTPTAIAAGDSIAAGTAVTIARSDHKHSLPAYATSINGTGTSSAAGTATTFARGDHVHAVNANTVVAGTIATGGVSAGAQLASGIVATTHIIDSNVTRAKIVDTERIPTGSIFPFVGLTVPNGWMVCEGGQVGSGTDLGILLGTRYNTGGETGGFVRVPDFRSKVPYGNLNGGTAGATSGGAATVGLTATNIPNHTHTYGASTSPTTHNHNLSGSGSTVAVNIDHTHSFSHTHTVTVTASPIPPIISETGALGTVLVAMTGGDRQVTSVTAGTGNAGNSILLKNNATSTWTAGTMDTTTVPTTGNVALTAHGHSLQGATDNESSHVHGFSGTTTSSTVNATATGTAFSIVPPYTGVGFIIKL